MVTVGLYLDAAGVVLEMHGISHWSCLGHSELIKENGRTVSGDRMGLKITFLEACAALLGISSMANLLANKPIVIYCDNIGMVYVSDLPCTKQGPGSGYSVRARIINGGYDS